jgi:transcriptional regulator
LARHYEPEASGGFDVDRMTPDYYAREVRGIVAFTLRVERLEAKFKLSQNRDEADHANIIRKLRARADDDSHGVAEAMARLHARRFGSEI